jgi:hypothetical protein
MTYGELANNFQLSFFGGRFKEFLYLGGNVVQYVDLKIEEKSPAIANATVIFNQNGQTVIINELNNDKHYITPLTPDEWSLRKEAQYQ